MTNVLVLTRWGLEASVDIQRGAQGIPLMVARQESTGDILMAVPVADVTEAILGTCFDPWTVGTILDWVKP